MIEVENEKSITSIELRELDSIKRGVISGRVTGTIHIVIDDENRISIHVFNMGQTDAVTVLEATKRQIASIGGVVQ